MERKYVRNRYVEENGGRSRSPADPENRLANFGSGRDQPGSGCTLYAKGDVSQSPRSSHDQIRFLFEAKQTEKKSISISAEWLGKITREAMKHGLEPALSFEIKGHSDPQMEGSWVAIPLSVFRRMQLIAEEEEDER